MLLAVVVDILLLNPFGMASSLQERSFLAISTLLSLVPILLALFLNLGVVVVGGNTPLLLQPSDSYLFFSKNFFR